MMAIIGALLSIGVAFLKYFLDPVNAKNREVKADENRVQELRKALEANDSGRVTAVLAEQSDRVHTALGGS